MLISSIFFASCNNDSKSEHSSEAEYLSLPDKNAESEILKDSFPKINYNYIVIRDKDHLDSVKTAFKETEDVPELNKMFCTLNRKERRFIKVGDTVLVADSVMKDMVAYSIFPFYYSAAKDIKKIILVSNRYQAYACYEYGKQVRFAATNTGKERTPSYPGRYAMVWKAELRLSSLDSTWKMPFTWNIHKQAGSAFHKFEMPGYPASHSCLRQFMDDAKWLYKWGEGEKYDSVKNTRYMTGTPVIIIDHFDFNRPRSGPWVSLRSNKDVTLELPDNPLEVEEALIPISQIPEVSRNSLRNKQRYIFAEDTLRARGVIREGVKLIASVDFNKLRRQKAARKAKELEEKKKLMDSIN
ncbi:hypothetical protein MASR1M45_00730 [Candidatus Kapaibacterium sp.]